MNRINIRMQSVWQWVLAWMLGTTVLVFAQSASATQLAGADSPVLTDAVSAWLEDDDMASLPTLSELARQGNIAAALLLARIERTTIHDSPFVRAKSRKQRHVLFRQPSNHIFAGSWIAYWANKGHGLARLLEQVDRSRSDAFLAHDLVDMGEPEAADGLIRRIAFYGNGQQRAQISGANLPLAELHPYVDALNNPAVDSRLGLNALLHLLGPEALEDIDVFDIEQAASYLHNGMPFEYLPADNPLFDAIARQIHQLPSLLPISNQCAQICPNDRAKCAVSVLGMMGGYYQAIRVDSPLESVIDQGRFLASRRASEKTLRRAALARDGAARLRASVDAIWPYCQCLATAIAQTRSDFGIRENR